MQQTRDEAQTGLNEAPESGAGQPRMADLGQRVIAGVIDTALAIAVGFIPVVGGLVATAYWLARDGLEVDFARHRSIGKKIMGLKPVRLDGRPMDLATSARRNWPFALGGVVQILMFIPLVGWLLMIPVALLALVIGIAEIALILTGGRRLGDRTADTQVVQA